MTMSTNDKQVILAEVQAAREEGRPVSQLAIRALLPHLSAGAVNSRVARLRDALNNPRPPRPRRPATTATAAPPQSLPITTVTTAATTPATGVVHVQVATSLTTATTVTADRADDEVQVAMQLARFGDSRSVSIDHSEQVNQAQQLLSASQGELDDVRSHVHAPHLDVVSREETIRMQDEEILSSRMERLQLTSTFSAMERLLQAVQSQLQVSQADIASRDETIMKLNQDLQALRSDQEIELRQLKSTLTETEAELSLVRTQVNVAKADIASKDDTIKKLNRDVEIGRRQIDSSKEILLQRKLDAALQESALKEEAIEKLKSDMKAVKDGFSTRMHIAQMNIKDQVTQNFQVEVQDLKNQVQSLERQYSHDVSSYTARIANLEKELRYTRWVTNLHKYLVTVEEDLQVLADRLSRYLASQDRSKLYSKRDPSDISVHPTMRWATRMCGRYYAQTSQITEDMATDMTQWWLDRNYFAHHSSTDELARHGKVLENAQEMHRSLVKLIEDLDQDRTSDLDKLANDAFSDLAL